MSGNNPVVLNSAFLVSGENLYKYILQLPYFPVPHVFSRVSTQFPSFLLWFFEYYQLLTFPTLKFPICESVISESEHGPTGYKNFPEFGKEVRLRLF